MVGNALRIHRTPWGPRRVRWLPLPPPLGSPDQPVWREGPAGRTPGRSKRAPSGPQDGPRGPRDGPRANRYGANRLQDGPGGHPKAPRGPQDSPQEGPKRHNMLSSQAVEHLRVPGPSGFQPLRPQRHPRSPQDAPGGPEEDPKTAREGPPRRPRRPQDNLRVLQTSAPLMRHSKILSLPRHQRGPSHQAGPSLRV